jgi:class 3 adenylate cyclase
VLSPSEDIHLEGIVRGFGLFHVEDAVGSPFVPAQEEFVLPYGVASVVGCGTMLPNGAVALWIGFARHLIQRDAALPMIPLVPAFLRVTQHLYRRKALFDEVDPRPSQAGERTELARLEDRLWEQQAHLSQVYAELSVKHHALSRTMAHLQRSEEALKEVNKALEEKVVKQSGELERSKSLERYLSPEVARAVLSGGDGALLTRKRLVTLFFADVPGFDDIIAEVESEEAIELLSKYHQELTGILFKHGGTLDKFLGARIMAFFGDPIPQEDHALRAVRAGVEMRDRLREMRAHWFPTNADADLTVGIHTGYATVGNVGSEHRMDYTVVGRAVTVASALQTEAEPGQVVITPRTHELVKEHFHTTPLQLSPRGGGRPTAAFAVVGPLKALSDENTLLGMPLARGPVLSGQRLGGFLLQDKLGEGGMGTVFRALDERLQRTVALKVLAAELAADARFVERFTREARALASLNSPYVAQIYAIGEAGQPPYFAMEFVEGGTLRQHLRQAETLGASRALEVASEVALGLQAALERGVIHRDIKPDNVMLTLRGQVKLTDFGLVKDVSGDHGQTTQGILLGTPLYMAPEQAMELTPDHRADQYALGVTLYEMLQGVAPFRASSAMGLLQLHLTAPVPSRASLPVPVPEAVYAIVARMLSKDRDDRYPTYEALLEALAQARRVLDSVRDA